MFPRSGVAVIDTGGDFFHQRRHVEIRRTHAKSFRGPDTVFGETLQPPDDFYEDAEPVDAKDAPWRFGAFRVRPYGFF